jgi:hypothetical protein
VKLNSNLLITPINAGDVGLTLYVTKNEFLRSLNHVDTFKYKLGIKTDYCNAVYSIISPVG